MSKINPGRFNATRRRPRGVAAAIARAKESPLGPAQGTGNAIDEQHQTKLMPQGDWRAPKTTAELMRHHKGRALKQFRALPRGMQHRIWAQMKAAHARHGGLGELPELLLEERDPQHPETFDPDAGFYDDWQNLYTVSNFPFVVGATSTQIIPANPRRTYLAIQNKSAGTMFVNFGTGANTFSGLTLLTGDLYKFEGGERGGSCSPGDSVHVIGNAAGLQGVLLEGVKLLSGLTAD